MASIDFLPSDYGYVVFVIVLYCFLNFWMAFQVGKARKKYKVFYPTLYASESENKDAKLFNCVQRGHQNSLEMMPMYFVLMVLGGIRHPCVTTGLGLVYIVSRYFYFTGYATGIPENRLKIGYKGEPQLTRELISQSLNEMTFTMEEIWIPCFDWPDDLLYINGDQFNSRLMLPAALHYSHRQ